MIRTSNGPGKHIKYHESDSTSKYAPEDEASYYLGDRHEMGGNDFLEKISNERDFVGLGPRGHKRSDERIFEKVCEALTAVPSVDATDVEVEVNDGIVYLRGTVRSRQQKSGAQQCVENLPGVKDVMNVLIIDFKGQAP